MKIPKASASRFSQRVLAWYDQHGRKNLPWQKHLSDKKQAPYRVWLSEIMLQQTQVATVIPYFEKFITEYPTLQDLARASQDDVLHLWSGLGYYARARNLHTAAKMLVKQHEGRFPDTVEALSELPGIGPSTAGAIISIAYRKRATILDGNVKRVLARHFALPGVPAAGKAEKNFWALAEQLTPATRVNHYTQAIMDLGATLCTRSQPRCGECPLQKTCVARQQGTQAAFPEKKLQRKKMPLKETRMLLVMTPRREVYLQKRPPQGIWGGLWSLPELALSESIRPWCRQTFGVAVRHTIPLEEVLHTFSHFQLRIHPVVVELSAAVPARSVGDNPLEELWYNVAGGRRATLKKGLAAPVSKLLKQLESTFNTRSAAHGT
jgi:A/G-specific adenine glycosylase